MPINTYVEGGDGLTEVSVLCSWYLITDQTLSNVDYMFVLATKILIQTQLQPVYKYGFIKLEQVAML